MKKPRCFLVYAHAPKGLIPSEVNRIFNEFIADKNLPLVLFHDHFIGNPGGVAVFYCETPEERELLLNNTHLPDWEIDFRPLIFSYSPSSFDEQISYTLQAYRGIDWQTLRNESRPSYGNNPRLEAETAEEE
jgi:hypothetical protein